MSLALPLARLLLRTFLPLAVAILFLKPCSFCLWIFLGWYVLSIRNAPPDKYSKIKKCAVNLCLNTGKGYYNHKIVNLSRVFLKNDEWEMRNEDFRYVFCITQKTFLLKFLICNGYRTENLKDAGHSGQKKSFTSVL